MELANAVAEAYHEDEGGDGGADPEVFKTVFCRIPAESSDGLVAERVREGVD